MKKKFKKKLLFYVILLLITFCISHFVSADTDSNLGIPPFYNIKANNVNLLNSSQYSENANETTFYINLNADVVYNNIWPNYAILDNIFNKYLIVDVCSLWTVPTQFYANGTGWSSGQVYMNNGSCFIDGYEGTLSTVILGWNFDMLDIWEDSSTTTTYKIAMKSNRNNFTFRLYYPNTRTIRVNSIYTSNNLPSRVTDVSAITKEQEQTNQKLDSLKEEQKKTQDIITSEDFNTPDFSGISWAPDTPVSNLVLMPLNVLNRIVTAFSGSCSPYNLTFFDNTTLTFPCFNGETYFGSDLWATIDSLMCLFMIYEIGMFAVSAFEDFTSLRDTYDKLYVPKHAKPLGKHTKEVQ